jgi:hypothetical protein
MLNPVQKRLAEGMNPLVAFLTEATCGEACWEAREDVCRCSCGGRNHGCLRTPDGVRPTRNAKIDGYRYELKAVGKNLGDQARAINKAAGDKHVKLGTWECDYPWQTNEPNAPARLKKATKDQLAKWPELASFREKIDSIKASGRYCWIDIDRVWPELLWVKV